MTTSTPLDARSLAHRLTTVGHALHHRLFAQVRDSGIHPKTVLLLAVIDGRIHAPGIEQRLARGGKRVSGLAERGLITPTDQGWSLTDDGRALLDRTDADHAGLLAEMSADDLTRLAASLDTLAGVLGVDDEETPAPGRGFGPRSRGGFGPGFGPGAHGFAAHSGPRGRRFRPDGHGFGPHRHGFDATECGGVDVDGPTPARHEHERHGRRHGFGPRHGEHGRHDRHAAQRAYERGFDAGFLRGRESAASE